jgi:hypothetical protein
VAFSCDYGNEILVPTRYIYIYTLSVCVSSVVLIINGLGSTSKEVVAAYFKVIP